MRSSRREPASEQPVTPRETLFGAAWAALFVTGLVVEAGAIRARTPGKDSGTASSFCWRLQRRHPVLKWTFRGAWLWLTVHLWRLPVGEPPVPA